MGGDTADSAKGLRARSLRHGEPEPRAPGGIPWGWKVAGALLVAGLVALAVWLVVRDDPGDDRRQAATPVTQTPAPTTTADATTTTAMPAPTEAELDALAEFLGIPREDAEELLRALEPNEPDYQSSGVNTPGDGGVGIVGHGAFARRDDVIFVMELVSAPSAASGEYQYGLGVTVDGQPQSTPNPDAPDRQQWLDVLAAEVGIPDRNTILIAHKLVLHGVVGAFLSVL